MRQIITVIFLPDVRGITSRNSVLPLMSVDFFLNICILFLAGISFTANYLNVFGHLTAVVPRCLLTSNAPEYNISEHF